MNKVFKALGVPNEWPASMKDLPLIGAIELPQSQPMKLLDRFAFLNMAGLRMLTSLLNYDSEKRWTASEALKSPYFQEKPEPTPTSKMRRFS